MKDWLAPSHVAPRDACEAVYCSHKSLAMHFEQKKLKNSLKVGLHDANFAKITCSWTDFSDRKFSNRALRGDFYLEKNV